MSPEHAQNVEYFTDKDDDLGEEDDDEKDNKSPGVTRFHVTHSVHRRTADVACVCAHVANTAAVTVFLDSGQSIIGPMLFTVITETKLPVKELTSQPCTKIVLYQKCLSSQLPYLAIVRLYISLQIHP